MRSVVALCCAALLVVGCGGSDEPAPASKPRTPPGAAAFGVSVSRPVELLSILNRLAGVPPFAAADGPYAAAVDQHFAAFRDDPAVRATRAAYEDHGVSYDAPMSLAIHLGDDLEPSAPLADVDARWKGVDLDAYLEQARRFASHSDFEGFEQAQAGTYADAQAEFKHYLDGKPVVAFFDALFGPKPGASYRLVPGLLTGGYSFGVRAQRADGGEDIRPIVAAPPDIGFVVHEVAHSYVNPIFSKREPPAARRLFATVADAMHKQAYATPLIMTQESVVRAITVLYLRDEEGQIAAEQSEADDRERSFTWISPLADAIDKLRAAGPLDPEALADSTEKVLRDAL